MTYPLVRLVEAPDPASAVRYDFNDKNATASRWVTRDFTLGSPTLEGDPQAVGVTFGFRQPVFGHVIHGSKEDALAALSALSRELLRRTGWLMFQLDAATSPVFLKIYRAGYEALSLDNVYVDTDDGDPVVEVPDLFEIQVPFLAEAFGYLERVTIPTFQMVQSPADLTTPTRYALRHVLPAIEGDAPTRLQVTITPAAGTGVSAVNSAWLIGCVAGDASMADTVVEIGTGDTFTAGTGTAGGSSDATFFGGTKRNVTISASEALISRLTGKFPNVPAGRYKVMLKLEADGSSSVDKAFLFRLKARANGSSPVLSLDQVSLTISPIGGSAVTFHGWVDLGDITLPLGLMVDPEIPTGQLAPSLSTLPLLDLEATTADGSAGALRLDAFKFIPISGPTVRESNLLRADFPGFFFPQQLTAPSAFTAAGTFDGENETYWSTVSGTGVTTGTGPGYAQLAGGFPVADPAAEQNLLLVMAMDSGGIVGGTSSTFITTLNAQVAVDVSYHPRVLHLGDGT